MLTCGNKFPTKLNYFGNTHNYYSAINFGDIGKQKL